MVSKTADDNSESAVVAEKFNHHGALSEFIPEIYDVIKPAKNATGCYYLDLST